MGEIKTYKDFKVWQKSMTIVELVYAICSDLPNDQYHLRGQIQRCAVSIPSNIAEGYGRGSNKNFAHFLKIARASLYELETQVEITKRLYKLNNLLEIDALIVEVGKMLNSLISKLNNKINNMTVREGNEQYGSLSVDLVTSY